MAKGRGGFNEALHPRDHDGKFTSSGDMDHLKAPYRDKTGAWRLQVKSSTGAPRPAWTKKDGVEAEVFGVRAKGSDGKIKPAVVVTYYHPNGGGSWTGMALRPREMGFFERRRVNKGRSRKERKADMNNDWLIEAVAFERACDIMEMRGAYDERKHPRAKDGKFASVGRALRRGAGAGQTYGGAYGRGAGAAAGAGVGGRIGGLAGAAIGGKAALAGLAAGTLVGGVVGARAGRKVGDKIGRHAGGHLGRTPGKKGRRAATAAGFLAAPLALAAGAPAGAIALAKRRRTRLAAARASKERG